ncbi:hypothetical protein CRYUN_Cryun05aG0235700 [Craigia yunnanensis]
MPPLPSSLLNPRLSFSLKPLFLFPQFSLAPPKFPIPWQLISAKPRTFSSLASVQSSATDNGSRSGGGRLGALSPSPVEEDVQRIDVNPPKGTRDFPPEDMRLRNCLFNHFREVSQLFGFEEVDYPVLESEALFIWKAGEEIRDQLYCFEDRGNRCVALRPELTPSLARLVIQKGKSLSLPLKWFAVGQCWRYERMTRGRLREHYQWNMDILGVPEVTAEAELISSIVTFFKRIGITESDVGFKISSRKVLQEVLRCYSVPENLFGMVCIIMDKIEKIPIDGIKRELNAIGLSEEAVEELLQVLSIKSLTKLEEILGGAGEAVADLKQLFSLADRFGYSEWIQFDASVVRGLAYYTGIVFEGFDREGKPRAICGGGRYDRLLSTFGGDDVPACGFGFGDAVIVEVMLFICHFDNIFQRLSFPHLTTIFSLLCLRKRDSYQNLSLEVDNIVCALDHDLQGVAATVATKLREKGQSVDLVSESKPLKWVFKRAARTNAQRLIFVGNTEWQKGMVSIKILSSGEQYEIKLDELE